MGALLVQRQGICLVAHASLLLHVCNVACPHLCCVKATLLADDCLPLVLPGRSWAPAADSRVDPQLTSQPKYDPLLPSRDGGVEAVIDHDGGFMASREVADVYATEEPQAAFHARVAFCLDIHNEVRRGRWRPGRHRMCLKQASSIVWMGNTSCKTVHEAAWVQQTS